MMRAMTVGLQSHSPTRSTAPLERRTIAVRGIVQGVGFRPFVYGLASRLSLNGFVRNTPAGVLIEVEGDVESLAAFERELRTHPPSLSSIDELVAAPLPCLGHTAFRIEASELPAASSAAVTISPDVATCAECVSELHDPANRRYRHPFITCATCGLRLTVVTGAPYDRARTTMARFVMSESCRREYGDPSDRRFHAETIACAACGPAVRLLDRNGRAVGGEPFEQVAAALLGGSIAAIKGLGGYHLACDAGNAAAVAELRKRKHRDEKPLAVMFDTLASVEAICVASDAERQLLSSPSRMREACDAAGVTLVTGDTKVVDRAKGTRSSSPRRASASFRPAAAFRPRRAGRAIASSSPAPLRIMASPSCRCARGSSSRRCSRATRPRWRTSRA